MSFSFFLSRPYHVSIAYAEAMKMARAMNNLLPSCAICLRFSLRSGKRSASKYEAYSLVIAQLLKHTKSSLCREKLRPRRIDRHAALYSLFHLSENNNGNARAHVNGISLKSDTIYELSPWGRRMMIFWWTSVYAKIWDYRGSEMKIKRFDVW